MKGLSGADFLTQVRETYPTTIRMLMTGYSDVHAIMKAVNQGQIYGYISKPWKADELIVMIQQAINHWEALEKNRHLTEELQLANIELERKVDERTRELRALENFNESVIASLQSGLMVVSAKGIIEGINPAGAGILISTVAELRKRSLKHHPHTALFAGAVELTLQEGASLDFQELTVHLDLEPKTVGYGTSVLAMPDDPRWGVIIIFRDVTEKKHLEEQLIQSEKLATIGELAGGVAHEINNPLGVILGFAQLLLRNPDNDEKVTKRLKHIETQALRCKHIVQTLLKFSRKSPTTATRVDLIQIIRDTLDLLMRQLEVENIKVTLDLQGDSLFIRGNENEIQQVFFNLIVNAKDSMAEGGELTIRAREEDGVVLAEVKDTGVGIDPLIQNKIFGTFFTTKPVGKGTGLGLPITLSLVRKYGGTLIFDSVPSQGTSFHLRFPQRVDLKAESKEETQSVPAVDLIQGLRILVVDDEQDILNLCHDLLHEQNDVELARGGHAALELLRSRTYDLLLCDIMMPQIDGVTLLETLALERPFDRPPVVVMTGRPPRELLQKKEALGIIEIVTKPFTLSELQSVLKSAWDWHTSRPTAGSTPVGDAEN